MNTTEINSHLKNLESSILPPQQVVFSIVELTKPLLLAESNIISIKSPVRVFGDIHGQFYDLVSVFDPTKKYLFLGDYVDRGFNSLETILFLLLNKLKNPTKIFLLRGNHESTELTKTYGFKQECVYKYSISVWIKFCELFRLMSPCALIDSKYFCVHGGLSAKISLKNAKLYDRTTGGNFTDMYWSDPISDKGIKISNRGAGYLFGRDVFEKFMRVHKFEYLIRSHQLVFNGYKEMFSKKLLIVWSAPNYCYKQGNRACYLVVNKNEHKPIFFDWCKVQYKDSEVSNL